MRSWLLLVSLAGCWTDRAPAQTTPLPSIATMERPRETWPSSTPARFTPRAADRCTIVIGHVFDLTKVDAPSSRFPAAMLDELLQSTIESCHDTQWSDESLDCYEQTTRSSDTSDCYRSMSTEQREDFERRFTDIMSRHRGGSPPPPTP